MKSRRLKLAVAVAIGAIAVMTNSARPGAYATYAKWGSNNAVVYINPSNSDGLSDDGVITAMRAAMDDWATQGHSPFTFTYGGKVNDNSTGYDNRNVVLFRNESNGGMIAATYSWWDNNNRLVDSDMIIYDADYTFFAFDGTCNSDGHYGVYVRDLTDHEFGHMLGLGHSSVAGATMEAGYQSCSMTPRSLESDDIAGLQSLYGTSNNNNPPANTAPSVSISGPGSNSSFAQGATINFSASATDTQDGNITARLVWTSSIDGQIGTGGFFARSLSVGTHTITAKATDNANLTGSSSITITVNSAPSTNSAPNVSISGPGNNSSFGQGATINFSASATDAQDGTLTANLVWTSNIDGQIGTGGFFARSLSAGTHSITARVTDNNGASSSSSISITVTASAPPPPPPSSTSGGSSAQLTARGYKTKGLQKADLSWSGLSQSQTDVYRNGSKVATTSNNGSYTDSIDKKGAGSYTYKVCDAGTSNCSNQTSVSF